MSSLDNTPVKVQPYPPYSGSTLGAVAKSFGEVHRNDKPWPIRKFQDLMRYVNGRPPIIDY